MFTEPLCTNMMLLPLLLPWAIRILPLELDVINTMPAMLLVKSPLDTLTSPPALPTHQAYTTKLHLRAHTQHQTHRSRSRRHRTVPRQSTSYLV